MAPAPSDVPHYDGVSPLDGGMSPASLGESDTKYAPSGLEIGVIVGVVAVAMVSFLWLFFWRSRRNRAAAAAAARDSRASSATATNGQEGEVTNTSGLRIPTPISKDDRVSTADNEERTTAERQPQYQRHPAINWPHWSHSPQANRVEQYEIPSRF